MTGNILVIDNSEPKNRALEHIINERLKFKAEGVCGLAAALEHLGKKKQPIFDAMIICSDKRLEQVEAFIKHINTQYPFMPIIVFISMDRLIQLPKDFGDVFQILAKPVSLPVLECALKNAVRLKKMREYTVWLEHRMAGRYEFSDIIGQNAALQEAVARGKSDSRHSNVVCIFGETGTGKELLARAIHSASARAAKPFVVVDCQALDAKNAYAILLGTEHHSGEHDQFDSKPGKLQEAEGGTLFLKDYEHLPAAVRQAVVQLIHTEAAQRAVNATSVQADVGFILAGNYPNASGPLLSKIGARPIVLPPLRERTEDIALLCDHFLALYSAGEQKFIRGLSAQAKQWLIKQPWPGNITQLAHTLRRSVIRCEGGVIDLADLMPCAPADHMTGEPSMPASAMAFDAAGSVMKLRTIEAEAIRYALQHCGGSMTKAARSLGIGRSTLYRKVHEMNLDTKSYISRANQTTRPMISVSSMPRS